MRFGITTIFLLTVVFNHPQPVDADEADGEARAAFNAGVDAFEAGNIPEALASFERAYALRPAYKILFNIAQAQAELGETEKAVQSFEKYLTDGGEDVSEGRRIKVEEELKRLRIKAGEVPPPTPPPMEPSGPAVAVSTDVVPVPEKTFLFDVAPWVSAGIAAVTLTTGIVLGAKAASLNNTLGKNCIEGVCNDAFSNDIDKMQHMAASADVMFVATTLFTAATVSLLVIGLKREKDEK